MHDLLKVGGTTQHLRSAVQKSRMKHSGEATLSNDASAQTETGTAVRTSHVLLIIAND